MIGIEYYIRGCTSKQCNPYGEGKLVNGDDDLLCSEKIFEIGYCQAIIVNVNYVHRCIYHPKVTNHTR